MRGLRKILTVVLFAAIAVAFFIEGELLATAMTALLGLLLWPWRGAKPIDAGMAPTAADPMAREGMDKAQADYEAIQAGMGQIRDPKIVAQIKRLQSVAGKLLQYLKQHPQRVPVAAQFIDYYQDRTAALVRQYLSLRETGVQTQATEKLRQDMGTTLQGFVVAYEKQFAKVIDHEVLDMGAEMKVARQVLQSEGIDCDELERTRIDSPERNVTKGNEIGEESKKKEGWNLKQAGIALGAVVISGIILSVIIGIYSSTSGNGERSFLLMTILAIIFNILYIRAHFFS